MEPWVPFDGFQPEHPPNSAEDIPLATPFFLYDRKVELSYHIKKPKIVKILGF